MKKVLYVVGGILLVLFVLVMVRNTLIKGVVETGVRKATGLRLGIGGLKVGVTKSYVDIDNLKLYNPWGFKDKVMLNMPKIYVDYDLPGFFRGQVHLRQVTLDLKEFVVVKNKKGELNLNALKPVKEGQEGKPAPKRKEGKAPALQIDNLDLKVGKVVYKDYSQGGEPVVQEYNINADYKETNITDLQTVVTLIVVRSLAKTTVSNLANFEMDKLQDRLTDMLSDQIFGGEMGKMGAVLKEAVGDVLNKE